MAGQTFVCPSSSQPFPIDLRTAKLGRWRRKNKLTAPTKTFVKDWWPLQSRGAAACCDRVTTMFISWDWLVPHENSLFVLLGYYSCWGVRQHETDKSRTETTTQLYLWQLIQAFIKTFQVYCLNTGERQVITEGWCRKKRHHLIPVRSF